MKSCIILFISILNVSLSLANEDDIINVDKAEVTNEIDSSTFENDVIEGKPHFIMFFAPWCGHCKRLHPIWHQLSEKLQDDSINLKIGKVDCTQQTPLCASQEINGYPTLKFYAKGPENSLKYKGPRDLPSLQKFIAEQLGLDYQEDEGIPKAVSGLVEFTDITFTEMIKQGSYFVKFYAPWCGHCQRLAPTWDLLAKSLEHDKAVVIGKLDCTEFKSVCTDYEVKGYPTLLWIEDGKKVAKYSGDRSHEDLKRFITEQLGGRTVKKEDIKEEVITVVTLTSENFENAISHGVTFIKFFAPWCGHCKRLAPTFEELGKKFAAIDSVTVAKVDCTQQVNKDLCAEQEIDGFPTMCLYKDGVRLTTYNGDRSLIDMADFISSKLDHDEL